MNVKLGKHFKIKSFISGYEIFFFENIDSNITSVFVWTQGYVWIKPDFDVESFFYRRTSFVPIFYNPSNKLLRQMRKTVFFQFPQAM